LRRPEIFGGNQLLVHVLRKRLPSLMMASKRVQGWPLITPSANNTSKYNFVALPSHHSWTSLCAAHGPGMMDGCQVYPRQSWLKGPQAVPHFPQITIPPETSQVGFCLSRRILSRDLQARPPSRRDFGRVHSCLERGERKSGSSQHLDRCKCHCPWLKRLNMNPPSGRAPILVK